ncbi:MAG: inorganic phosphate transporter [Deltaproteobacteria bacterium]|nr:inorganic phosphate transporter [Deltaproteobacteria bacterium]
MTILVIVVFAVGVFLGAANGANDVSKGIATLVGSRATDMRRAIWWGTAWTAAGAALSALVAGAMLATFGGDLFATGFASNFAAALATLVGAAGWVAFATRFGLPVSTTHAIVGALVGVAVFAYGFESVNWSVALGKIVVPLLASPLAAFLLTTAVLHVAGRASPSAERVDCLCVDAEATVVVGNRGNPRGAAMAASPSLGLRITRGSTTACAIHRPAAARVTLGHLQWLTSGATSFARGMNDTPKIVALIFAAVTLSGAAATSSLFIALAVALAMTCGALIAGRRVTRVLAHDVTPMDAREGSFANLVTAGFVTTGAVFGWPMSTTHVSSGAIVGAGLVRGSLNQRTLRNIALAWIVTLPAAAGLGIVAYAIASGLTP